MKYTIKTPSSLNRPWRLSSHQDTVPVVIPQELTKLLRNYHIIGIQFLYNNYKNGLNGAILNQEYDMNLPLEVTAFLSAVFVENGIVLVICPDELLGTWHYHLTNLAKFTTKSVTIDSNFSTPQIEPNFDKIARLVPDSPTVVLVKFSNLKLLESLLDLQYFCVIVDKCDELATKLVLNRLQTRYKIALIYRNFMAANDSKIQWKLLNWSNAGCVGQSSKFARIDAENFTNFRDNYHYWWLRLSWRYDDDFQPPTPDEIEDTRKTIENWTVQHFGAATATRKSRGKRKIAPENYVQLPSMDEKPILKSIRRNFAEAQEPIKRCHDEQPSTSRDCSESANFRCESAELIDDDDDDDDESLSQRIRNTLQRADDLLLE